MQDCDGIDNNGIKEESVVGDIVETEEKSKTIVFVNVGGVKYGTLAETLKKFPNVDILACGVAVGNNEYFIDRNGEYFRYILDFLRSGHSWKSAVLPSLAKEVILCIKEEAKYYGLYDMMFGLYDAAARWDIYFCEWVSGKLIKDISIDMSSDVQLESYYSCIIPYEYISHRRQIFFDMAVDYDTGEDIDMDFKEEVIAFGIIQHFNLYSNQIDEDNNVLAMICMQSKGVNNANHRFSFDFNNGLFTMSTINESNDVINGMDSVAFDLPNNDVAKSLRFGFWPVSGEYVNDLRVRVIECDIQDV